MDMGDPESLSYLVVDLILKGLVAAIGVNLKIRQVAQTEAELENLREQMSEQAATLSSAHQEALLQKKKAEEMAGKVEQAEGRAKVAEDALKELRERLGRAESELEAQKSLEEVMEGKIQKLKREAAGLKEEKAALEGRLKKVELQASSGKTDRLAVESKLLAVELAHSNCKTHTTNLLSSLEQATRDLKTKEEAWMFEKKVLKEAWQAEKGGLEEDIADGFTTGVDQMKAFLTARYSLLGVDWATISMEEVLAIGVEDEGVGQEVKSLGEGAEGGEGKKGVVAEPSNRKMETKVGRKSYLML